MFSLATFGFSIRSFGSWGEAQDVQAQKRRLVRFSIRSFGSWGEACQAHVHHVPELVFQYPLFRIVG